MISTTRKQKFSTNLPVGDGKFFGGEILERITQGPECLFDVQGELTVFLEAFFWIGIDLGFSTITLFEAMERFVDEVIASFDWECTLDAPTDIAQLDTTTDTLTLSYRDASNNVYLNDHGHVAAHQYKIEVLAVDDDLTQAFLIENGYLDPAYTSVSEEQALANQFSCSPGRIRNRSINSQ